VSAESLSSHEPSAREAALESLASSSVRNIPGVDFVSITVLEDHTLSTAAATDPLAVQADALQYEMREGPCYAAVTNTSFVLTNDIAAAVEFPRYGPSAVDLGVGAQAAIRLVHGKRRAAGLNLYARSAGSFDRSTVQIAELLATHAATLLNYAEQVDQLSMGLRTRTDIGTAVGILMERYNLDRHQAFTFLARNSQHRNIKVRLLALQVIDDTFQMTPAEARECRTLQQPAPYPTPTADRRSPDGRKTFQRRPDGHVCR